VLLFLASALAATAVLLALAARPPQGLAALLICLALFAVGGLLATSLVAFPHWGPALLWTALMIPFVGWGCWMIVLRGPEAGLRRKEVADGAMHVMWGGARTLGVSLPVAFVAGILILMMVYRPWLILLIPASVVGAAALVAFHLGSFDSLLSFVLTPLGISFTLEYVGFVSGLRVLIHRRT
jgi:hypothetical protein